MYKRMGKNATLQVYFICRLYQSFGLEELKYSLVSFTIRGMWSVI
jgi:hypothetical protein